MRRWLAIVVVAAVSACGGGGPSKTDQARSVAQAAGLAKDVADFFALATSGQNATHRVTLQTTDTAGQQVQYTVTQRLPDRRFDEFRGDTIDSTISTNGTTYQCTKAADVWQCGALGPSSSYASEMFADESVKDAIARFKQQADDYDFQLGDRTIVGVAARCLVTSPKPGHSDAATTPATMCLSKEGVILLVQVPSGTLTATSYTTEVPGDAFVVPASPTSTTAN